MLYASFKALHLLGIVVWVGGMFFMLACLRPAAHAVLDGPTRVRLMHATMRRFFNAVAIAIVVIFLSGAAMVGAAWREAAKTGLAFNMPLDWYTMIAIFFVMLAVFVHLRAALFRRLERAVADQAWPAAAALLHAIRWEVMVNLVLGAFIIVVVRLGAGA